MKIGGRLFGMEMRDGIGGKSRRRWRWERLLYGGYENAGREDG